MPGWPEGADRLLVDRKRLGPTARRARRLSPQALSSYSGGATLCAPACARGREDLDIAQLP